MQASQYQERQIVLEQLKTLSEGLYFLSESEYPFEVVALDGSTAAEDLEQILLKMSGLPAGTKVVMEEPPYFFRTHTDESLTDVATAQRFKELQQYLEQNLENVNVYKIGERKITAFIIGLTASGDYVGLKTFTVET